MRTASLMSRLMLERRNFLLATTLAARGVATTAPALRPGEASSPDEKTLLFVRHAEGFHNKGERELPNWNSDSLGLLPKYRDARLTDEGHRQSARLNAELLANKTLAPELVVVSTLSRTIQTAEGAFKDLPGWPTTYLATELCRERIAAHECDHRRMRSELAEEFRFVDWSGVTDEDDVLWTTRKEILPDEMHADLCIRRGGDFLTWLRGRPERRIAIVSHWVYMKHLFRAYAADYPELSANFKNAELRTAALYTPGAREL